MKFSCVSGTGIQRRQLRKHIVRMLMIDQRFAVISLASLEKLRKSWMRRGQRLRGKHLPEKNCARAQLVLLHQHAPVHRLGFARATGPALLVVVDEDDSVRHQFPPAPHPHPFVAPETDAGCHVVPDPAWGDGICELTLGLPFAFASASALPVYGRPAADWALAGAFSDFIAGLPSVRPHADTVSPARSMKNECRLFQRLLPLRCLGTSGARETLLVRARTGIASA